MSLVNPNVYLADGGSGDPSASPSVSSTTADTSGQTNQGREYNNLWDWIRYGWEDLVNHPSTWGGLSGGALAPGSTNSLSAAIDMAETLDTPVLNHDAIRDVNGNITKIIEGNASINDAFSYGKVQGDSVEDKLLWLINNDPENAQGWMEQLLGYQASKESINDAREYEKMMQDTRVQRAAKDLEAAGINPILAYQYLSGSGSSVSSASMPDSNVSTNAVARQSNQLTNKTNSGKAMIAIVTALLAIAGIAVKAVL